MPETESQQDDIENDGSLDNGEPTPPQTEIPPQGGESFEPQNIGEPKPDEGEGKEPEGTKETPEDHGKGKWKEGDIRALIKTEYGGKSKEWKEDEDINTPEKATYFKDGKIYDLATDELLTDKEGKGAVGENEDFRKVDEEMRKGLAEKGSYTFKFVDEKGTHITFVRLEGEKDEIKYSYYLHQEKEPIKNEKLELDDDSDETEMFFDDGGDEDGGSSEVAPLVIDVNVELQNQLGVESVLEVFKVETTEAEKIQLDAVNTFSIASLFNGTSFLDRGVVQPTVAETSLKSELKVQPEVEIKSKEVEVPTVLKKEKETAESHTAEIEDKKADVVEDAKELGLKTEAGNEVLQGETKVQEIVVEKDEIVAEAPVIKDVIDEMPTGIEMTILTDAPKAELEATFDSGSVVEDVVGEEIVEQEEVIVQEVKVEVPKKEPEVVKVEVKEAPKKEEVKIVPVAKKPELVKPEIKKAERKEEKVIEPVVVKAEIKKGDKAEERVKVEKVQKEERVEAKVVETKAPQAELKQKKESMAVRDTTERGPIVSPYVSRLEVEQGSFERVGVVEDQRFENQSETQPEVVSESFRQENIVRIPSFERSNIVNGVKGGQSQISDELESERRNDDEVSDPLSGITMRRAA